MQPPAACTTGRDSCLLRCSKGSPSCLRERSPSRVAAPGACELPARNGHGPCGPPPVRPAHGMGYSPPRSPAPAHVLPQRPRLPPADGAFAIIRTGPGASFPALRGDRQTGGTVTPLRISILPNKTHRGRMGARRGRAPLGTLAKGLPSPAKHPFPARLPYPSMPGRASTSCMAAQRRCTSSRGLT